VSTGFAWNDSTNRVWQDQCDESASELRSLSRERAWDIRFERPLMQERLRSTRVFVRMEAPAAAMREA
jgi:hypothetical protein